MLQEFKKFALRGNVIDLAVGVIIGGAFDKIVTSLVNDIINPIVGIILGSAKGLQDAYLMVGSAKIMWGSFVSTGIDFVIIAFVVYYGVKLLKLDTLTKK